jgi:Flp pilus assembly protein TadG
MGVCRSVFSTWFSSTTEAARASTHRAARVSTHGAAHRLARLINPRAIARERRAVAALEFAAVLAPLLGLLLATLQIPLIFFADQALQSAATNAGRLIMTGSAQEAGTSQAAFQQSVCAQLTSLFSCANLMVDVESASSYGAIGTGTPTLTYGNNGAVGNQWAYNPGGPGDIVIVRVMYNWPVFASALIPGLANQPNNQRLLVGATVLKNEPYQ